MQRLVRSGLPQLTVQAKPLTPQQITRAGERSDPERQPAEQAGKSTSVTAAAPTPPISPLPKPAANVPRIQAAWYNFNIPFTNYQFDPSIEGIKTAAGVVKDAAVGAFDWVVDQIKGLIDSGKAWLKKEWDSLQEAARSAWDDIKKAFSDIVSFIKDPLGFLADAITSFDADAVNRAWTKFSGLISSAANGFKAMTDGLFSNVNKVWSRINGFATSLLDKVTGMTENFVFRKLPDALQKMAFSFIAVLRDLWKSISDGWTKLFNKIKSWVDDAVDTVLRFVRRALSFGINVVISGIVQFGKLVLFLRDFIADPQKYIAILAKQSVQAFDGVEGRFAGFVGKYFGDPTAAPAGGTTKIQRSPEPGATVESKTSASWGEIGHGIAATMGKKWNEFKSNPMTMVMTLLRDMVLPIVGNVQDVIQLFKDIKKVVTGPLSAGSLEELWTSLLQILDIPIMIYHTVVSILMRSLMVPLIVATFVPHPLVKAIAAAVGYGLLGAFVQGELMNLGQKLLLLKTGATVKAQKEEAYNRIADSLIALAMAAVITVIMLLLHFIAQVAKGIYNFIKGKIFGIEAAPVEGGVKPEGAETKGKAPEGGGEEPETIGGKRVLGETKTADGHHELKLTEDGRCIHCSPGCGDLEAKYPEEIKQTGLQEKLNDLKPKEASDPSSVLDQLKDLETTLAKQRAENLKVSKAGSKGALDNIEAELNKGDNVKKLPGKDLGEFKQRIRELTEKWDQATKSADSAAGDPELEGLAKQEFDGLKAEADKLQGDVDGKLKGPGGVDFKKFYEEIKNLPAGERVAKIMEMAEKVAQSKGFVADRQVSALNNRTIYADPATGDFYSLDTQHGTFEHCGPGGAHIEELNFGFERTAGRDTQGFHDIRVP